MAVPLLKWGGVECHFTTDLACLIPTGIFDCRSNEKIADVYFAEFFFVNFTQNEPHWVNCLLSSYSDHINFHISLQYKRDIVGS